MRNHWRPAPGHLYAPRGFDEALMRFSEVGIRIDRLSEGDDRLGVLPGPGRSFTFRVQGPGRRRSFAFMPLDWDGQSETSEPQQQGVHADHVSFLPPKI